MIAHITDMVTQDTHTVDTLDLGYEDFIKGFSFEDEGFVKEFYEALVSHQYGEVSELSPVCAVTVQWEE